MINFLCQVPLIPGRINRPPGIVCAKCIENNIVVRKLPILKRRPSEFTVTKYMEAPMKINNTIYNEKAGSWWHDEEDGTFASRRYLGSAKINYIIEW